VRASIDLAALRDAARERALDIAGAEPVWSDDRRIVALCVAEAAHPAGNTQAGSAHTARRWLDAWRAHPGEWPDLDGVVAAGLIVDLDRAEIVAAIDRMGVHALYWSLEGEQLRVATRAAAGLPPGSDRPQVDPAALYAYVYFHHVPSPLCIYRGVAKLPRAHCLRIRHGEVGVRRYRLETFDDPPAARAETPAEALMARLRVAVGLAMQGTSAPGAFLSGGLDSSTVAGLMAERLGRGNTPSFSIGFDAAGYDEMQFARTAARHFGLRAHEHYITPDEVLELAPPLLRATDEPFGNSSITAAYRCALLAREAGVDRLLAGDGGDELFAGNSRYLKQLVFERYVRVPPMLRRGVVEPLLGTFGRLLPASPLGKAARYVEQARVPLPDRLQSYNYLHRHDPGEVFEASFLGSVDVAQPLRLWREEYAAPTHADAVNRMLFLDWAFTLHDNDLVKVNSACRAAGVQVAYPMLDHALVDFACALPGPAKMPGRELRGFYKQATRALLPAEIIGKSKHGFGLPFGVWTRTHPGLARMSEAALDSLAGRGILRKDFLRETLRLHREGHAVYYGELVWVLTALELWLDAHGATLPA
jgi:asparagine synthase (glutamine-hydrolysing)